MFEKKILDNNLEGKGIFHGEIRPPLESDLAALRPILESWIRDRKTKELLSHEVENVLEAVRRSLTDESSQTRYLIAEEDQKILGMIGIRPLLDERIKFYAKTKNPAEGINAYVDSSNRAGRGVGRALGVKLEEFARTLGYEEIILNSGPRYKETAWGFYNKLLGEPVGVIKNMYGEGGDAPVWRKVLESK